MTPKASPCRKLLGCQGGGVRNHDHCRLRIRTPPNSFSSLGQSERHLNAAVSNSPSARGRGLSCVGSNVDRRWHRV
jgi:hypothetical protein